MNRKLRVLVIGCGLAARRLHVPALRALEDVEVAGLFDRDPERVRGVGEAAGLGDVASGSSDLPGLLARVGPDVALVLTPPESHRELASAALDAGAHVLVEKPFVYTTEEADQLVARAAERDRHLSVIHNELFTPSVEALRRRVAGGELGELVSVHYWMSHRDQRFVPERWYFETHGGRMGETLPHALALLVELLPDLAVRGVHAARLGHAVLPEWMERGAAGPDELRVELAARDGSALGSVWYSFNSQVPASVLACGTEGHLLAHPFGPLTTLRAEATPAREALGALAERARRRAERLVARLARRPRRRDPRTTSHYRQLAHFFACLREGRPPTPDPRAAREVVRLWSEVVDRLEPAPEATPPPR